MRTKNVIRSQVLTSEFAVLLVFFVSFRAISVVSALGAQLNSLSDYNLDILLAIATADIIVIRTYGKPNVLFKHN
jgi:hypothetical protein